MPPKKIVKQTESFEQLTTQPVTPTLTLTPTHTHTHTPTPVDMSKKPSTLVKFSTNDSDRLQLAQAINNITLSGDTFARAIDTLSSFSQERLSELDMQIETKKREYEHMTNQLENNFKNNQIETQQRLNEFKVKACDELAKDFNMQVIKNDDFYKLKNELSSVQKELNEVNKTFDERLSKDVEKEKQLYTLKLQQETTTLSLNHKAQMAEITAQCAQQKKEIDMLNKTIDNLKH